MNGHVGKPLDLEDVLATLRKFLLQQDPTPATEQAKSDANDWKYGVAWSPELETGNEEIDSQHRQLFKLTSDLVDACAKGQSPKALGEALEFLASYTVKHFVDEEALQLKYHFPEYENHRKLHEDFKKTAADLVSEYKATGSSADLNGKVNSIVIRWLVQHIKGEDSKIAAYIREQGKNSD
jgi:hemerythrin